MKSYQVADILAKWSGYRKCNWANLKSHDVEILKFACEEENIPSPKYQKGKVFIIYSPSTQRQYTFNMVDAILEWGDKKELDETNYIEDKIDKELSKEYFCDMTGKSCTVRSGTHSLTKKPVYIKEFATITAQWGYASKKDGEKHTIILCEEAYDKILEMTNIQPHIEKISFDVPADTLEEKEDNKKLKNIITNEIINKSE